MNQTADVVIVGAGELGPYGSSRTRFEMEVDTTRANVAWEREVADNLAQRS